MSARLNWLVSKYNEYFYTDSGPLLPSCKRGRTCVSCLNVYFVWISLHYSGISYWKSICEQHTTQKDPDISIRWRLKQRKKNVVNPGHAITRWTQTRLLNLAFEFKWTISVWMSPRKRGSVGSFGEASPPFNRRTPTGSCSSDPSAEGPADRRISCRGSHHPETTLMRFGARAKIRFLPRWKGKRERRACFLPLLILEAPGDMSSLNKQSRHDAVVLK